MQHFFNREREVEMAFHFIIMKYFRDLSAILFSPHRSVFYGQLENGRRSLMSTLGF